MQWCRMWQGIHDFWFELETHVLLLVSFFSCSFIFWGHQFQLELEFWFESEFGFKYEFAFKYEYVFELEFQNSNPICIRICSPPPLISERKCIAAHSWPLSNSAENLHVRAWALQWVLPSVNSGILKASPKRSPAPCFSAGSAAGFGGFRWVAVRCAKRFHR